MWRDHSHLFILNSKVIPYEGIHMSLVELLNNHSALLRLAVGQLHTWPEHELYLERRFHSENQDRLLRLDKIASKVLRIIGDRLPIFCADYRWMCENFLEEELHFRRTGRYRYSSFAEVNRFVYSDEAYMSRYVNGILLSQVFWQNHAAAIDIFGSIFLPGNIQGYDHLEVGPGHGLFLALAAKDPRCASVVAWDVSPSSIAATKVALAKMEIDRSVKMEIVDILEHDVRPAAFDSIIISEVLEHLEDPEAALRNLYAGLRPGGRIFINVPVNSPAPDHIYLWTGTEQVEAFVTACGFHIEAAHHIPLSGWTLERARRQKVSISCVIFASK
jgi:2-polyprenyl-3-methyl-5-hydroxy-6-metoxy-1,4-benzoquinol methylase